MLELRSKEPHSINQLPKAVELCVVTLNLECAQGLTTALPGPRGLLGWSCPHLRALIDLDPDLVFGEVVAQSAPSTLACAVGR